MRHSSASTRRVIVGAGYGFLAGVVSTVVLLVFYPQLMPHATVPVAAQPAVLTPQPLTTRKSSAAPPISTPISTPLAQPAAVAEPTPTVGTDVSTDVAALRARALELPVRGVSASELRDSFNENRAGEGVHHAIDILAPRNTPIVAVEDGTIAKLFLSKPGGLTIYQFDPTSTYVYYYAHLESYAVDLREGMNVTKGDVIGYVGTSGNAPPQTPHLHFEIGRLTPQKQWWKSTPINPFEILR